MIGMEIHLPAGRECFIEIRKEWVGFGTAGSEEDREIYLGFAQAVVSRKRGYTGTIKGQRWLLIAAFLCGLAVPMDYGEATKAVGDWTFAAPVAHGYAPQKENSREQGAGQR
ncbi:hypothetical protein [Shinella zoogloeoides]|uniref:hypothetical protein n=1 Tax=Shinella zoogloeoides TaxID=352475 RepID=UPI0028A90401|nr:hypothetical protein [Shinella zoogloeoides]